MEVGADQLFAVNGVETSQKCSPLRDAAVVAGICEVLWHVFYQLVTEATPRHPAVFTRRVIIDKRRCRKKERLWKKALHS